VRERSLPEVPGASVAARSVGRRRFAPVGAVSPGDGAEPGE